MVDGEKYCCPFWIFCCILCYRAQEVTRYCVCLTGCKKILHKPHFVRKKAHFTEAFHMRQFSNNLNLPVFLCFLYPAPCLSLSGFPGKRGGRGRKGNRNRGSKKIASGKGGGNGGGLVTCPGFAGYCSESYPGDTCLVVCAFGRNNVPVCQVTNTPV